MVPVIPGLVFVHATQQQVVTFKRDIYNDLQFVIWSSEANRHYLIVPDKQMSDFIRLCEQKERKVTFHKPGEIQLEKGTRSRTKRRSITIRMFFVRAKVRCRTLSMVRRKIL